MKINLFDLWKLEIDWKAIMAIAVCILGYAIITI